MAVSILSACSIDGKMRRNSLELSQIQEVSLRYLKTVPTQYQLKPGDRLSLVFMADIKKDLTEAYTLDIGDEIRVSIYDREDLSGSYVVVPDGWIYLPLIRPLKVKGLTLEQLNQLLVEEFKGIVKDPQVTVGLNRFNNRVSAFINSLSQFNPQGSVYEAVIDADGAAIFPQLGAVHLSSMTLDQANGILYEQYRRILPGIDVTARISSTKGNVITILGEVKRPGSFEIYGNVTLIAALGLAEGWNSTAHLESVILVQQRKGEYYLNKYDLEKNLIGATQIQMAGGDLIFIPRTAISDVNVLIDQFLRKNLPINIGVGIPIN